MRPIRALVALVFATALILPLSALAAAPQPKPARKGNTDRMASAPALIKLIYAGKGGIKSSIRGSVRDSTDIFMVNWPYVLWGGHSTTLYSLGKSGPEPDWLMHLIKNMPDAVLCNTDRDFERSSPKVEVGTTYAMGELGEHITLVVVDVSPSTFTLVDSSHRHKGSVSYGAFKDSAGELWLFEECTGDYFTSTSKFIGLHHRHMTTPTHNMIEAMLTAYGRGPGTSEGDGQGTAAGEGPCPAKYSSNHVVGVNGPVTTEVQIKRGDKVRIHASGQVTFGVFAGSGGPEGIQFMPSYNHFPDSPHGCLMGRIRGSTDDETGRWFLVGNAAVLTAENSGTLELDVNDNDPGNNTGQFRVEISVCRAH